MSSATAAFVDALTGTIGDVDLQTVLSTDNSSQGEIVTPMVVTHPDTKNQDNPFANIHGSTNTMGTSALFGASPLFGTSPQARFCTSATSNTTFFADQQRPGEVIDF